MVGYPIANGNKVQEVVQCDNYLSGDSFRLLYIQTIFRHMSLIFRRVWALQLTVIIHCTSHVICTLFMMSSQSQIIFVILNSRWLPYQDCGILLA